MNTYRRDVDGVYLADWSARPGVTGFGHRVLADLQSGRRPAAFIEGAETGPLFLALLERIQRLEDELHGPKEDQ